MHYAHKTYKAEAWRFAALAAGLVVFQGVLGYAALQGVSVALVAAVHIVICSVLWWVALRRRWLHLQGYKLLLILTTGLFSLVGTVATVVGYVFTLSLDLLKPAHFAETFDDLFDLSPDDTDTHVFRHVQHYNVVGAKLVVTDQLLDMFKFGSSVEKQNVLSVINNNYQPKFAKILRMALQDSDNVIRIQAAAILADLEQRQQQKLIELEAKAKTEAAKTPHSSQAQLELAGHYDDIAHSGVVDQVRRTKLLTKAAEIFEAVYQKNTQDAAMAKKLARVYYRLDKPQHAAEVIAPFAKTMDDISLSLWYLELLFVTHNRDELRAMAKKLAPKIEHNHAYPIKLQKAVKLWAI